MSTAVTTLPCSAASSKRRPVQKRQKNRKTNGASFLNLPSEVVEKIVQYMVIARNGLGVVLLSMTSRQYRQEVTTNLEAWYRLYLHWRGPVRQQRTYRTRNGVVTLQPTYPHTLPNFRTKPPCIRYAGQRMLLLAVYCLTFVTG